MSELKVLVSEFFDILFPGDKKLGTPSFSDCDKVEIVYGFFSQIDNQTTIIINKIDVSEIDPDELINKIEAELPDVKRLLNSAISFYFSRPNVVISLTDRGVPLATSGVAIY